MSLAPGKNYIGDSQRIDIRFSDDVGLYDPTTVIFKTRDGCGRTTTYTYGTDTALRRVGVGEYLVDFTLINAGRWYYQWKATDDFRLPFAREDNFIVQVSAFECAGSGYA